MHPLDVLRGRSPRDRALEAFAQRRRWATQRNRGGRVSRCVAARDIAIGEELTVDYRLLEAGQPPG